MLKSEIEQVDRIANRVVKEAIADKLAKTDTSLKRLDDIEVSVQDILGKLAKLTKKVDALTVKSQK